MIATLLAEHVLFASVIPFVNLRRLTSDSMRLKLLLKYMVVYFYIFHSFSFSSGRVLLEKSLSFFETFIRLTGAIQMFSKVSKSLEILVASNSKFGIGTVKVGQWFS